MKRTIREWFKMLPEPYRTQALKNQSADRIVSSMAAAIMTGFTWWNTPQGEPYWDAIWHKASEGEIILNYPSFTDYLDVKESRIVELEFYVTNAVYAVTYDPEGVWDEAVLLQYLMQFTKTDKEGLLVSYLLGCTFGAHYATLKRAVHDTNY